MRICFLSGINPKQRDQHEQRSGSTHRARTANTANSPHPWSHNSSVSNTKQPACTRAKGLRKVFPCFKASMRKTKGIAANRRLQNAINITIIHYSIVHYVHSSSSKITFSFRIQIWFKLVLTVKVYQARTVQGPNKMLEEFQDVGFLEEQQGGHESKKSVLLRHERAMQMPEHADCIEIFWLQSPCTCYLFGLFINPLT